MCIYIYIYIYTYIHMNTANVIDAPTRPRQGETEPLPVLSATTLNTYGQFS